MSRWDDLRTRKADDISARRGPREATEEEGAEAAPASAPSRAERRPDEAAAYRSSSACAWAAAPSEAILRFFAGMSDAAGVLLIVSYVFCFELGIAAPRLARGAGAEEISAHNLTRR